MSTPYSSNWDSIFGGDDDDEENPNEADFDREPPWMNKDGLVLLIDARSDMFVPNAAGETPFRMAVQAALLLYQDKIISSDWDMIGWALYGTKEKKNANDFEGVYVLRPLDQPDAQGILDLEQLLEVDVAQEYGQVGAEFPFGDSLWATSTMFSSTSTKIGTKRVFVFTNDDNPNGDDDSIRNLSLQRARDLSDLGIEIELFALPKPGDEPFDATRFFREIINVDEDEDTGQWHYDAAAKFNELKLRIRRKEFKKRAQGRLTIRLDGDAKEGADPDAEPPLEIGVQLYNLVQETKKGTAIPLDAVKNEPVKRVTKYVCDDTGSILLDYQILSAYDYGGEKVIFEKEQLQKLRVMYNPGLTLLGFKPKSALKVYHNLKHSSFLYPDEHFIQGSTVVFAALLDRMLALEKIAICRITARSNASPHLCALLPQEALKDEDGSVLQPAGIWVIILPFADDIRSLEIPEQPKAEEEQIGLAHKVIAKLSVPFNSRAYENPSLQKHYSNLQAVALDRGDDEVEDGVLPDLKGMKKHAATLLAFKEAVLPDGYNPDPKKTPAKTKKRPRGDDDEDLEPTPKKPRLSAATKAAASGVSHDWNALVESGGLAKLTLADLKGYCSAHGIKKFSRLSKQELVEVITNHIKPPKRGHANVAPMLAKEEDSDD